MELSQHEARTAEAAVGRVGRASEARYVQETACREVDLSWSYLEDGSKLGLLWSYDYDGYALHEDTVA